MKRSFLSINENKRRRRLLPKEQARGHIDRKMFRLATSSPFISLLTIVRAWKMQMATLNTHYFVLLCSLKTSARSNEETEVSLAVLGWELGKCRFPL
jgi:hypothetical protein